MPKKQFNPSEAELEILQILWKIQPTTVRKIHEILSKKKDVGYTTILKQMQRMYHKDKGMLTRVKEGKTHLYTAIPKESKIKQGMLSKFVDAVFEGSQMDLVMHALGKSKTSKKELEELQKWLDEQKKK